MSTQHCLPNRQGRRRLLRRAAQRLLHEEEQQRARDVRGLVPRRQGLQVLQEAGQRRGRRSGRRRRRVRGRQRLGEAPGEEGQDPRLRLGRAFPEEALQEEEQGRHEGVEGVRVRLRVSPRPRPSYSSPPIRNPTTSGTISHALPPTTLPPTIKQPQQLKLGSRRRRGQQPGLHAVVPGPPPRPLEDVVAGARGGDGHERAQRARHACAQVGRVDGVLVGSDVGSAVRDKETGKKGRGKHARSRRADASASRRC